MSARPCVVLRPYRARGRPVSAQGAMQEDRNPGALYAQGPSIVGAGRVSGRAPWAGWRLFAGAARVRNIVAGRDKSGRGARHVRPLRHGASPLRRRGPLSHSRIMGGVQDQVVGRPRWQVSGRYRRRNAAASVGRENAEAKAGEGQIGGLENPPSEHSQSGVYPPPHSIF